MLRKPLHGGNVYKASQELNIPIDQILDFSANINPLGYPPEVEYIIKNHIKDIIHYPDTEQRELKESAAGYYDTTLDMVLPGNGSVELINIAIETLKPAKAIIPSPTFSEYAQACENREIPVEFVSLLDDDFNFTLSTLDNVTQLLTKNSILILCNPNNPTGKLIPRDTIKTVLEVLELHESYLLLDEAFMDFVEKDQSMAKFLTKYPNMMILKSVTKFFALPGLRLGFILANPELIQRFDGFKDPWNINTFAGVVGAKVLKEREYIQKTRSVILEEKKWLLRQLEQIPGFAPYYPEANFIFVRLNQNLRLDFLTQKLREQGILIRDCSNYMFLDKTFFRVAVKNRGDNEILVARLKDILCEKGSIGSHE